MDVTYIGGNSPQKIRMHRDEAMLFGNAWMVEYGTANPIDASNLQPALWCLSAWANGATGVLPWQTIGSARSLKQAEQTALFYPGADGPLPSVRLKAFRYGQQLVEYLTLLAQVTGAGCSEAARWLREQIDLGGVVEKRSEADAGTQRFGNVTPGDLWRLRRRIGAFLSDKAPPYKRALVTHESPAWQPERLPDIGYVSSVSRPASHGPACDSFRP